MTDIPAPGLHFLEVPMTLDEARAKLADEHWRRTATDAEFRSVYRQVQEADIASQFGQLKANTGPGGYSGGSRRTSP